MTDDIKDRDNKDRDNKDAEESGRPVQLDPEEQGGKPGQGQQDREHDKQGVEHGGQRPAESR